MSRSLGKRALGEIYYVCAAMQCWFPDASWTWSRMEAKSQVQQSENIRASLWQGFSLWDSSGVYVMYRGTQGW